MREMSIRQYFSIKSIFITILLMTVIILTASCNTKNTEKVVETSKGTIEVYENGNLINGGFVVQQGDWVYYCNGGYQPICKFNQNTNQKFTFDYYGGSCINIKNDWIYYIAISEANGKELIKMTTDGKERVKLLNVQCDYLYVKDDFLYYTESSTGNLYKAKTDGTGIIKLSDDKCNFVNIVGDSIYYSNGSDNNKIYRIKNNKKSVIVDDSCSYLNVIGDYLIYINESNGKKVYKVKVNGKAKTLITKQACKSLNVADDWIYYTIDENDIHKIKFDGTMEQVLPVKFSTSTPCLMIFENYLYYFSPADGFKICRISLDGKNKLILD